MLSHPARIWSPRLRVVNLLSRRLRHNAIFIALLGVPLNIFRFRFSQDAPRDSDCLSGVAVHDGDNPRDRHRLPSAASTCFLSDEHRVRE